YSDDFDHAFVELRIPAGVLGVHACPMVERKAILAGRDAGDAGDFLVADRVFEQVAAEEAADVKVAEGAVLPFGHADDFRYHKNLFNLKIYLKKAAGPSPPRCHCAVTAHPTRRRLRHHLAPVQEPAYPKPSAYLNRCCYTHCLRYG